MDRDIRILLVEEPEARGDLRKLAAAAQLNMVGEAGHGPEAVTIANQLQPDVVVIGMEEPVARPLKSIEGLVLSQPGILIVAISSLGGRDHMRKAMQAGARDYLVKPVRPRDLHRAVVNLTETELRRQAALESSGKSLHQGEVISVFGVKGGIGKTSLSVNLATAIAAQTKQRVGLLDLDMQLGDVAVMLNFLPERTIMDAAESVDRLEPELLQSLTWHDPSGVSVLAAPLRPEDADEITSEQVSRIVEVMAQTYDYVVVDTPPLISSQVGAILDRSTLVLLLTTQELLSLRRTKIAIQMMRHWNYSEDKVKLVINYAYHVNGVMSSDIESTLEYPIFWKVPNDPTVSTAARKGRPFVESFPKASVSKNVVDLARIVCGLKKRNSGLIGRLWSR